MKIALILDENRALSTYPSVFNTANILTKRGYEIDIFVPEDMELDYILNNVTIIKYTKTKPTILGIIKILKKYARKYNLLMAFHPEALIASGIIAFFYKIPTIYFCLEIISNDQLASLKTKIKKYLEIIFNKRALFTIVQDVYRAEMIKNLHRLNNQPIICVPNSYIGINSERSDYLRKKFGISESKKIILYAGGIERWAIDERLIKAVKEWDEKFVLVLHGWSRDGYIKELLPLITEINKKNIKIYLSESILTLKEYEQMLSSADIGLAWYKRNLPENVRKIGFSSGKTSAFLRSGIPVVLPSYLEGISEFIKEHRFGICVDDEFAIGGALVKIDLEYQEYRKNAFEFYKKYLDFEKNFEEVIRLINEKVKI